MKNVDMYMKRMEIERHEEWHKWLKEIPFITFKDYWQVKVTPPFGGLQARFRVKSRYSDTEVSVYLDCYERAGVFGEPYWEIYPYEDDVYRVAMKEVEELVDRIDMIFTGKYED